jgi:hypothetical protein
MTKMKNYRIIDLKKFREMKDFKIVTKSLVVEALKVLEDIQVEWELDRDSEELREKFLLLEHYLDYLKRFSEGKV